MSPFSVDDKCTSNKPQKIFFSPDVSIVFTGSDYSYMRLISCFWKISNFLFLFNEYYRKKVFFYFAKSVSPCQREIVMNFSQKRYKFVIEEWQVQHSLFKIPFVLAKSAKNNKVLRNYVLHFNKGIPTYFMFFNSHRIQSSIF